ncbi:origin recognition complex subunit 2-like [Centruroides sculpturatus]|uniref:origin recognition complex subunit 2-like n=1 Tax=Centruroides sculpturatus TaxID=218467 RepID=UPI000C6D6E18|nr:origin recognition complex subunit 2-like [Centruroides sculpturatus]XP_023228442.1 origin recognition complex subunit 2-like [Centruroides sculpturatus]
MTEDKDGEVVVKFIGDEDVFENIVHISLKREKNKNVGVSTTKLNACKLSTDQELITDEEVIHKRVRRNEDNASTNPKNSIKSTRVKKVVHSQHISDSDNGGDDGEEEVKDTFIKDFEFNNYFIQSGNNKHKTSSHTLAELKMTLSDDNLRKDSLKSLKDLHAKEKYLLRQKYRHLYNKWYILLNEGFNILLYGLGSKIQIMEDFYKEMLGNSEILVINGFFPGLTIKHILNTITEDVIKHNKTFRDPLDQVKFIMEEMDKKKMEELYLIINNIDAPLLCSEKSQSLLSYLIQSPHIHAVASIDHINAPLIWDQTKLNRYNWIWFDATTFSIYSNETSYENSLLTQKHGKLVLSSLIHVFNSLTPNAQGIFMILARYQYDQKDNSNYTGMLFQDCYQQCREAFLVNSDLTLRSQLTEFIDHKLLRLRKSLDGTENLTLLLNENTLQEFLELQDDS